MGANGSSLTGKASLAPSLRLHGLTSARLLQVDAMFDRFRGMGSTFALGLAAFENLTSLEGVAARQIFREIFDTDRNGLVDAYEVMGCLTLCSQLTKAEKIERMYRMFDFNGAGGLTLDEMTMLLRCAAYSCAKTDPALSFPATDEVELMSATAFELAQVDAVEGEMTLAHFQDYCTVPLVAMFLDYFDSPLCQVDPSTLDPTTGAWFDGTFSATGTSLYEEPLYPPSGQIDTSFVVWRRLRDIVEGGTAAPRQHGKTGGGEAELASLASFRLQEPVLQPVLLVDDTPCCDVVGGLLPGQWVSEALRLLMARPALLRKLFVGTGQEHLGRYCVALNKHGNWHNVLVDDQVPCLIDGEPMTCRGAAPNEIWMTLVEKAMAKIHGSYGALSGGSIGFGLRDLTGGDVWKIDLRGGLVGAAGQVNAAPLAGMLPEVVAARDAEREVDRRAAVRQEGGGSGNEEKRNGTENKTGKDAEAKTAALPSELEVEDRLWRRLECMVHVGLVGACHAPPLPTRKTWEAGENEKRYQAWQDPGADSASSGGSGGGGGRGHRRRRRTPTTPSHVSPSPPSTAVPYTLLPDHTGHPNLGPDGLATMRRRRGIVVGRAYSVVATFALPGGSESKGKGGDATLASKSERFVKIRNVSLEGMWEGTWGPLDPCWDGVDLDREAGGESKNNAVKSQQVAPGASLKQRRLAAAVFSQELNYYPRVQRDLALEAKAAAESEAGGGGNGGNGGNDKGFPYPNDAREFVMTYADFLEVFNVMWLCRCYGEEFVRHRRYGEWSVGTGRGSLQHRDWYRNPQFALETTAPRTTVVIQLMQPAGNAESSGAGAGAGVGVGATREGADATTSPRDAGDLEVDDIDDDDDDGSDASGDGDGRASASAATASAAGGYGPGATLKADTDPTARTARHHFFSGPERTGRAGLYPHAIGAMVVAHDYEDISTPIEKTNNEAAAAKAKKVADEDAGNRDEYDASTYLTDFKMEVAKLEEEEGGAIEVIPGRKAVDVVGSEEGDEGGGETGEVSGACRPALPGTRIHGITSMFRRERQTTLTCILPPGRYVVVPMTYDPLDAGDNDEGKEGEGGGGAGRRRGRGKGKGDMVVPFQMDLLADGPVRVRGEAAGEIDWIDGGPGGGDDEAVDRAAMGAAQRSRLHVVAAAHVAMDDVVVDGDDAAGRRQTTHLVRFLTRELGDLQAEQAALEQFCVGGGGVDV